MKDSGNGIGLRISQIRNELDLNKTKFARKLSEHGRKFDHSAISRYESGEIKPKSEFYDAVEAIFGYNSVYIRTGAGRKFLSNTRLGKEAGSSEASRVSDSGAEQYSNEIQKEACMNVTDRDKIHQIKGQVEMLVRLTLDLSRQIDELAAKDADPTLLITQKKKEPSHN